MNTALIIIGIPLFLGFLLWAYKTISFARKYDVHIESRLTNISKPKEDDLSWTKSKTTVALYVTNQGGTKKP